MWGKISLNLSSANVKNEGCRQCIVTKWLSIVTKNNNSSLTLSDRVLTRIYNERTEIGVPLNTGTGLPNIHFAVEKILCHDIPHRYH